MEDIIKRLEMLEYHQQLLIQMVDKNRHEFDWLIIKNRLTKEETAEFFKLCEELNKKYQEQKADGFVFHVPLFQEFEKRLHSKLDCKEVIAACIKQGLYKELMIQLYKNLSN
ncbi:DUF1878 family protein [Bacillus sp. FSL W8-0102]|uniref:DUF1878 family protein n=1 Tax=Bacillus sp. FSL W8-0102 TaxID=2978205 RepID=UPI0030F8AD8A